MLLKMQPSRPVSTNQMPTSNLRNHAQHRSVRELTADQLGAIQQFDTCMIANAIERFGVRLRNEGFTRPGLHCLADGVPRVLGYAATFKIRSSDPPMVGNAYFDRTDWWNAIQHLPAPRIAVIEDLEAEHSAGSALGEVHAAILKAFRCQGVITNGAVRDLPAIRQMEFAVFARSAAVSHSYAHIVEYGGPVEIFGLRVQSSDLLYADCHGVVSIPLQVVEELPRVAAEIRAEEQRVVAVCQSPHFSPEMLLQAIKGKP